MTGPFSEALMFLVRTGFDLYIVVVALRFLLQMVRADFYNPISQFLVRATNPVLRPLRRVLPGYGGIDWSSLVFMLALKALEIILLILIAGGRLPAVPGLLVLSLAQVMHLIIYIFIVAVLIQVILSWISPGAYNPATVVLHYLTEPLLRPARQLIPPLGGLDLSPIAVFIFLQLTLILIINPLENAGRSLAGYTVFLGG